MTRFTCLLLFLALSVFCSFSGSRVGIVETKAATVQTPDNALLIFRGTQHGQDGDHAVLLTCHKSSTSSGSRFVVVIDGAPAAEYVKSVDGGFVKGVTQIRLPLMAGDPNVAEEFVRVRLHVGSATPNPPFLKIELFLNETLAPLVWNGLQSGGDLSLVIGNPELRACINGCGYIGSDPEYLGCVRYCLQSYGLPAQ